MAVNINVRWADNTAQLRQNLQEGLNKIEATRAATEKMVQALSGDKLIMAAHKYAAAVEAMGGVEKLNAQEKERINALVTKAIEKYELFGKVAPDALHKLRDATATATTSWGEFVKGFDVEQAITNPLGTAKQAMFAFADTLGPTAVKVGAVGASVAAVGVALFGLAKKAAGVGAELDDMADKTGLSVPALSRLSNAAQVAGTDIGTLSNAVFQFEQRLGQGSKEFQEGMQRIGLSVEEVKRTNPDRWLELIASKLQAIEDPTERAAAVIGLFGRQGRDLIPVLNDLNTALELTNDIQPWTAEQAADAEKFEMQLKALKVRAEAFALGIGRDLIAPIADFIVAINNSAKAAGDYNLTLFNVKTHARDAGESWEFLAAAVRMFRGEVEQLPTEFQLKAQKPPLDPRDLRKPTDYVKDWQKQWQAMATLPMPDAFDTEREALKKLEVQTRSHTAATRQQTEALTGSVLSFKKYTDAVLPLTAIVPDLSGHLQTMAARFMDARESVDDLAASELVLNRVESETGAILGGSVIPAFSKLPNVIAQGTQRIKEAGAETQKASEATSDWSHQLNILSSELNKLAQITDSTVVRSIAEFVGAVNLADKAGDAFREGLDDIDEGDTTEGLTKLAGSAIAVAGAFLQATKSTSNLKNALSGAAIGAQFGAQFGPMGAVVGGIIGGIGGALRNVFSSPEKQINPIREAFVQMAGGLGALNEKAARAGVTLTALLNARNPQQYQKAIDDLNKAFELQEAKDSFVAMNGGFTELERRARSAGTTLEAVLNAKTPEAYKKAVDELNDALKFQDDSMKVLEDTVAKYGLSLEQLGPQYRQGKLNESFKTLFQDQQVLSAAGVDYNLILQKQAPEMQKLLDVASKTGAQIPLEMKPALEAMAKLGLLTDASGEKLTDVSKLTFAETLDSKFQTLIQSIEKLVRAISRGLGGALDDLPKKVDVDIDVNWRSPGMPAPPGTERSEPMAAATGGFVTPRGIEPFAISSFLAGAQRLGMGGFAGDTVPAMLTPGELVLNRSQQTDLISAIHDMRVRTPEQHVRPITNVYNVTATATVNSDDAKDGDRVLTHFIRGMRENRMLVRTAVERVAVKALTDASA